MTREQVLSAVRAALGRTPGMTVTQLSVFRRSAAPHFDRVATFRTALEEVGGHFHDARHEPAEALILRVARESGCSRVFAGPGVTLDVASASRDEALTRPRDVLGVAHATAGLAETGTVVIDVDGSNLPTLVTESCVVILDAATLVDRLEDLPPPAPSTRARILITGPSRTADIEKKLVMGAHGPRALHVIVDALRHQRST